MKSIKFLLMFMLMVGGMLAQAQNYAEVSVVDINMYEDLFFCYDEYDGVIIYGRSDCQLNEWRVDGQYQIGDYIVIDRVENYQFWVSHTACYENKQFSVGFLSSQITNPFANPFIWKRQGDTVTLNAGDDGGEYEFLWSNGETSGQIEVSEPGTYSVTITDACGSETYFIEVRDNVEIALATCDLESNLNMVIWQTTLEQAEYVQEVNVYRNVQRLP